MVANVGAKLDALGSVVEHMTLGEAEVPALPRGEPGGALLVRAKIFKEYSDLPVYVIAFLTGGRTLLH
jgi:hypothetical protein